MCFQIEPLLFVWKMSLFLKRHGLFQKWTMLRIGCCCCSMRPDARKNVRFWNGPRFPWHVDGHLGSGYRRPASTSSSAADNKESIGARWLSTARPLPSFCCCCCCCCCCFLFFWSLLPTELFGSSPYRRPVVVGLLAVGSVRNFAQKKIPNTHTHTHTHTNEQEDRRRGRRYRLSSR